jgi:hypothetical protein
MSLVSGEGVPEGDVVEVVSEVQEWLQSQPNDPYSVSPFHSPGASQMRCILILVVNTLTSSYQISYMWHFLAYTTSSCLRFDPAIPSSST